jgi:N-acetylglucosaminyldiphosphoundecaprenol N-acetyl-beta-D-mannosaminyltransferase
MLASPPPATLPDAARVLAPPLIGPSNLPDFEHVSVLGVRIANVVRGEAIAVLRQLIEAGRFRPRSVFFVNAHTLNLAAEQPAYGALLNRADAVFGDGTGVRWAARMQGVCMRANLCGTDLVPLLIGTVAPTRYRYFLLGARDEVVAAAAAHLTTRHPGLRIVGTHHGHFAPHQDDAVVEAVNRAHPDVLLVAMGNPMQEEWIHANLPRLQVRLCLGVGGLFDHWAGVLNRAPQWVRAAGFEWVQLLLQQPHKWRRYLLGNPHFLWRAAGEAARGRRTPSYQRTPGVWR